MSIQPPDRSGVPPAGAQPPQEPDQPVSGPGKTPEDSSSEDAYLLKSPFAKMFTIHGAKVTAKQIRAIMNGILMRQVQEIKKTDKKWKEAMKRLRKVIEGQ